MNLKFVLLLFFNISFFCTALFGNLNAQTIEIKTSFYDKVSAQRSARMKADYNLKGNIKNLTEISPGEKDTTIFDFNEAGFLLRLKESGSQITGKPKLITAYTFENNQLNKIRTENPFNKSILEEYYGPTGYLEKHIHDFVDYEEKFHEEAFYSYNISHKELKIKYRRKNQSDNWDLILEDKYTFDFNSRLMLSKVRNVSKHKENTYGSTIIYKYDSLSGKLIYASSIDDCAGSNSCLDLALFINYDEHGNIIYERLDDRTIRNAGWTYGYVVIAIYNENNDVVEEYRSSNEIAVPSFGLKTKLPQKPRDYQKLKKMYEYEYDSKGNWIKKYSVSSQTRTLIRKRAINYY